MNFHQKPFLQLRTKINAGGIDHVPPTLCLLPACASAHVPAYVERTGRAGTKNFHTNGTVRHVIENGFVLHLGQSS